MRTKLFCLALCLLPLTLEASPMSTWTVIHFHGVITDPGGFFESLSGFDGYLAYDPLNPGRDYNPITDEYYWILTVAGFTNYPLENFATNAYIYADGSFRATGEVDSHDIMAVVVDSGAGTVQWKDPTHYGRTASGIIASVPEPASAILLGVGLLALCAKFRKTRSSVMNLPLA